MTSSVWQRILFAVICSVMIASRAYSQGGALQVTPTSVDFGTVNVGSTATRAVTVSNNDSEATITFSVSVTSGASAGFFIASQPATTTLRPGQSTTFSVGFRPVNTGPANGSVVVNAGEFGSTRVALSGQGNAPPMLEVSPTSIDFGTANVGDTMTRTVTVTNAGEGSLSFLVTLRNGSDPGFFIASQPNTFTLGPGQSTTFDVGFKPRPGSAGQVMGFIDVASNGGNVAVGLQGNVTPQGTLDVNPTAIDFGPINIGDTATRTVTVTNTGRGRLTFSVALTNGVDSGFFIATQPATTTLGPGESTTFDVGFKPANTNAAAGAITVKSNVGKAIVTLRGRGNTVASQPRLEVQPTAVNFGAVNLSSTETRTVTVRNAGSGQLTFSVALASGANAGFFIATQPAATTLGPGESATFDVGFRPTSSSASPLTGSVTITSNGGNAAVALQGLVNVPTAPVLEMNTTALDFGDVLVGDTRTLSFTIRNAGGSNAAPLEITSVVAQTLEGLNNFEITSSPTAPIPPAGTGQVSVTFAPQEIDQATGSVGQITITSNAGPPVTLTVRGRGIVRLSFGVSKVVHVTEGLTVNIPIVLEGRPPAGGLTVPLEARFTNEVLDRVLNQNLPQVLQLEEQLSRTVTFTEANEQQTLTFVTRDVEVGPPATLTVGPAAGSNPAVGLAPLRVVLKPDNSPDLLRTFNCGECQAGFTQDGDNLTITLAYYDRNSDVNRLQLTLHDDQGKTLTLPVITTETTPALPTGSRGFAIKLLLRNISSFGHVQSIDLLLQDKAGNSSIAVLPDSAGPRGQSGSGSLMLQLDKGPRLESIEVILQP